MTKTFRKKKKEEKETEDLKKEFEQNKQTHTGNLKLLEFRVEAEKAVQKDWEFNKRKFELTKGILGIELKHLNIVQPMMEFHERSDWQEKFKELRKLEMYSIKRDWSIFQKDSKTKLAQLNKVNVDEITEQQKRMAVRNTEITSRLKDLGVELDKPIKQDYIG